MHTCKDCGQSQDQVKFTINYQGNKGYVLKRCNVCQAKWRKKREKEKKLLRIKAIGDKIRRYFIFTGHSLRNG